MDQSNVSLPNTLCDKLRGYSVWLRKMSLRILRKKKKNLPGQYCTFQEAQMCTETSMMKMISQKKKKKGGKKQQLKLA